MDESDAVEAFERLGLTSYEAKVFIALQRIGSGSARDVAQVTDVPRSQVYSAAESLADRGLVGIQQSSPKQFRPVSIEAARSTLRDRFERESDRAFDFVARARAEGNKETKEDIWTIRGPEGISDRTVELIHEAEETVVFGTRLPELLTETITQALVGRAENGVDVTIISEEPAVKVAFQDEPAIDLVEPPANMENDRSGRVLLADHHTILLSVISGETLDDETAIWSSNSSFASVLIQLVAGSLGLE